MKSDRTVMIAILGVMAAVASGILLVSAPAQSLVGNSSYSLRSAFHGLFAAIFMVTVTIGVYQAFRLWAGTHIQVRELGLGSVVNCAACLFTIMFGNWIYIPYRAQGGPKAHFMETLPEIHKIFFEFKEFSALFTFPLLVAATYIIWQYKDRLTQSSSLRTATSVLLFLGFFYFLMAFGLGAAITKLRSV